MAAYSGHASVFLILCISIAAFLSEEFKDHQIHLLFGILRQRLTTHPRSLKD